MYDGRWSPIMFQFHSLKHSMRMHCYVIYVKTWVFYENQHYSPNIEDIFTKFTRHPMNWINMMSSKGQVYAKLRVLFILNSTVYVKMSASYVKRWHLPILHMFLIKIIVYFHHCFFCVFFTPAIKNFSTFQTKTNKNATEHLLVSNKTDLLL